jgi:methylthioribose-1-phosphate isomerase
MAMLRALPSTSSSSEAAAAVRQEAQRICDEDASFCHRIGEHGRALISAVADRKRRQQRRLQKQEEQGHLTVNILTHCNAGWLAFVDHGSATAPIYAAHDDAGATGCGVHVFVDETRPRNQGASLTAWELAQQGVPHTLVADNTGGHLMQHAQVDMVIVGADRVTRQGDVANKVGTYLKALAAKDNGVPFYVALPSSTFDFALRDGVANIPIELRSEREVTHVAGKSTATGDIVEVLLCPPGTAAANYAFDVTPARLVTAFITERGVCDATEAGILGLFPEKAAVRVQDSSRQACPKL